MAKKSKGQKKISKVMSEYKHGALHSGSKKGPKVTNPKQAVAIALSEARKEGAHIPSKKKVAKLHRKEEKLHHIAEKAMKADEKVHKAIEGHSKKHHSKKHHAKKHLSHKLKEKLAHEMHEARKGA